MGFFSSDTEADAINMINKINVEVRAISAILHRNNDIINGYNRIKIKGHISNIISYVKKYERIKNNLSEMDCVLLMGATVDVWNGERVGVFQWETYLQNTLRYLSQI